MLRLSRPLVAALGFGAAIVLTSGTPLFAAPTQPPVQYIIHFSAFALPPGTAGSQFRSNTCTISPALNPLVAKCVETGLIRFSATGGSGSAKVSSPVAGINWTFTLTRTGPNTYQMSGKGTESYSGPPVLRPVRVTGTIQTAPTPDLSLKGTEYVSPYPPPPERS